MKSKPTYEELAKRVQELEQTKYDHELMDEKLRESEERFRTVIEQSPSAIEIYEPNGKLLIVNDAWESFWNMKKSDMVDFNILNDPECERAGLTSGFKKVLQNIECSIPPSKYAPKESGFPG
ncbi:MAG: PAS domain S-box protein, partial [Desulfobacteraceae bacterium]|nr:PAS domain S-box protein [Desulfobacteraceae bacterium]